MAKKRKSRKKTKSTDADSLKGKKITAMDISAAETVGLTKEQVVACKDRERLYDAMNNMNKKHAEDIGASVMKNQRVNNESPEGLPAELIERAKTIGLTDEQIATYGSDSAALETACNKLRPQATAIASPVLPPRKKKRQIFKPFKEEPKGEPAQITFTSTIEVYRAAHVNRAGFDDSNLGVFCRNNKIPMKRIHKVSILRNYVPDKRDILTSMILIHYLRKG